MPSDGRGGLRRARAPTLPKNPLRAYAAPLGAQGHEAQEAYPAIREPTRPNRVTKGAGPRRLETCSVLGRVVEIDQRAFA